MGMGMHGRLHCLRATTFPICLQALCNQSRSDLRRRTEFGHLFQSTISALLGKESLTSMFGPGSSTMTFFLVTPPRLTEFCTEMIHITIPQSKTADDFTDPNMPMAWTLDRCKEHNCYDTDCKDYSERVKK